MQKKFIRSTGLEKYPTEVTGESQYQENIYTAIGFVDTGQRSHQEKQLTAELHLEDDNSYDRGNAVRVEINGQKVGYLSKHNAAKYRAILGGRKDIIGVCNANAFGRRDRTTQEMIFGIYLDVDLDIQPVQKPSPTTTSKQPVKKPKTALSQASDLLNKSSKNKWFLPVVIAVMLTCFVCFAMVVDRSLFALEQNGYISTRTPWPTETEYINFSTEVALTRAAEPTDTPRPTITPQRSAWTACELLIEQQLGLSPFDAQKYNPDAVTPLGSDVFTVKIYYAKYKSMYQCSVQNSEGDWVLLGLELIK